MPLLPSIFGRRKPCEFSKRPGKRTRFAEADPTSDLRHRERRHSQQVPGVIYPARHMVAMWRHAERLRESTRKMIETEACELCESSQRNVLCKMFFDEFGYTLLLPRRQAAMNGPGVGDWRSVQTQELVRYGHGRFPRSAGLAAYMAMMVSHFVGYAVIVGLKRKTLSVR
jgi:hypothetical protein